MKFIVSNQTRDEDRQWLADQLMSQYWGKPYTYKRIMAALEHSLNFWLLAEIDVVSVPIGFARVVTDRAILSTVTDVFVVPQYQKRGLGRSLMSAVVAHPHVRNTNCVLGTSSAEGFYRKFGFGSITPIEGVMMRRNPDR